MANKVVKKKEAEPRLGRVRPTKKVTKRSVLEEKIDLLKKHAPNCEEIKDLEKQLELSKRGKSSRTKGSTYERTIAKVFKDKLNIELVRTPQSGGFVKNCDKADDFRGDITSITHIFRLHIEAKNHAKWQLTSWLKQAQSDCPKSRFPVVVFHQAQKNEGGKRTQEASDYVCMKLEDFLEVVDRDKIIQDKGN